MPVQRLTPTERILILGAAASITFGNAAAVAGSPIPIRMTKRRCTVKGKTSS